MLMVLIDIEKNKINPAVEMIKNIVGKEFTVEDADRTALSITYTILPRECMDEEQGYYSPCVIDKFNRELGNIEDKLMKLVESTSPIAVVATPLPFTKEYTPYLSSLAKPYATWLSKRDRYNPLTLRLMHWLVIITSECYQEMDAFGLSLISYNVYLKSTRELLDRLEDLYRKCYDIFEDRVEISNVGDGVYFKQKDIESYRKYLQELKKRIEDIV